MQIITAYATKNPCYTQAQRITPKGIVVHSTGANNPYLKRYVDAPSAVGKNTYGNHWNNANMQVCVHSFIGYDINGDIAVANILPYDFRCWGVGSGKNGSFNNSHIQFEICEDSLSDAEYFNKIWDTAVKYCAYLCEKFSFDPMGKNVIVGHCEAYKLGYGSNHGDPEHWFGRFGKNMNAFRNAVKAFLAQGSAGGITNTTQEAKTLYRVQIGAYSKKENATAMLEKLKAAGFDGVIVSEGDTSETLALGSSVKVRYGATSYTGQSLASFVYERIHKVKSLNGDRAVITYNGVIVAAVKASDLLIV